MVGYGGKDLQKRKVLSLEWKSEGVMDDESGELMEPNEEVPNSCEQSQENVCRRHLFLFARNVYFFVFCCFRCCPLIY